MKLPLQITYRNIDPTPALEKAIRSRAAKLDQTRHGITACRVALEAPHRHHHKGRRYRVRVDLTVPGAELVAGRRSAREAAHEDAYVAIRDAFRAARRELDGFIGRRRDRKRAAA